MSRLSEGFELIVTKTLDELEEIKDKISNEFSKIIAYEKTVQVVDEHRYTYFPESLRPWAYFYFIKELLLLG